MSGVVLPCGCRWDEASESICEFHLQQLEKEIDQGISDAFNPKMPESDINKGEVF